MRSHICVEKKVPCIFLLGLITISSAFLAEGATAVTYQDSIDVSFTFNPTISINLSSDTSSTDLIIDNLVPGSIADSNTLTVSVTTNAAYGYYLTATAGTSSTNTDLVNTSNSNYKFTSLAPNADLSTLTTDNTWGYRTSDDNGSTWSNYSGLPKDNNDEGATGKALIETTSPVDNKSIKFKIGAKASTDQASGTYTNIITFYAVTSPEPEPPVGPEPPTSCNTPVPNVTYMQDITSSNRAAVLASLTEDAPYYLRDSRDNEPYCVSKLRDGNIWFLDNLRLDLTNATVLANTTASNTNASATSLNYLKNGGGTESDQYPIYSISEWPPDFLDSTPLIATNGDCYNNIDCVNDPTSGKWTKDSISNFFGKGSGKIGAYYNYCTASAGSYCYSYGEDAGDATEDICPIGWKMPSGDISGEYAALGSHYLNTYADNNGSLQYNLSITLSGAIHGGGVTQSQDETSRLWTSSLSEYGYMLTFSADYNDYSIGAETARYEGLPMRCVLYH